MDLQGQKVSDYTFEYRRILIKETKYGDGDCELCYAVIIHFSAEMATLNPTHLHKHFIFRSPAYIHTHTHLLAYMDTSPLMSASRGQSPDQPLHASSSDNSSHIVNP